MGTQSDRHSTAEGDEPESDDASEPSLPDLDETDTPSTSGEDESREPSLPDLDEAQSPSPHVESEPGSRDASSPSLPETNKSGGSPSSSAPMSAAPSSSMEAIRDEASRYRPERSALQFEMFSNRLEFLLSPQTTNLSRWYYGVLGVTALFVVGLAIWDPNLSHLSFPWNLEFILYLPFFAIGGWILNRLPDELDECLVVKGGDLRFEKDEFTPDLASEAETTTITCPLDRLERIEVCTDQSWLDRLLGKHPNGLVLHRLGGEPIVFGTRLIEGGGLFSGIGRGQGEADLQWVERVLAQCLEAHSSRTTP